MYKKLGIVLGETPNICLLGVAGSIFQKIVTEIVPALLLPVKRQTSILLNFSRILCNLQNVAEGTLCDLKASVRN